MRFLNVATQIIVLLPIDLASVSFNAQFEHLLTHEILEIITAQMVVIPAGIPVFVLSTSPVCETCSALSVFRMQIWKRPSFRGNTRLFYNWGPGILVVKSTCVSVFSGWCVYFLMYLLILSAQNVVLRWYCFQEPLNCSNNQLIQHHHLLALQ